MKVKKIISIIIAGIIASASLLLTVYGMSTTNSTHQSFTYNNRVHTLFGVNTSEHTPNSVRIYVDTHVESNYGVPSVQDALLVRWYTKDRNTSQLLNNGNIVNALDCTKVEDEEYFPLISQFKLCSEHQMVLYGENIILDDIYTIIY